MRVDDFDYHLPPALIAQRPLDRRDASRLLVVDRATGRLEDAQFSKLPDFLTGSELIVFNNARVIPARLFGKRAGVHSQQPSRKTVREHLSGIVEVFLTRKLEEDVWEALVRPGKKMQVGERVLFGKGELEAEILSRGELGIRSVRFTSRNALSVEENLEQLGHVPLPPYIDRPDEAADRQRYQTVYARRRPRHLSARPHRNARRAQNSLRSLRNRSGCSRQNLPSEIRFPPSPRRGHNRRAHPRRRRSPRHRRWKGNSNRRRTRRSPNLPSSRPQFPRRGQAAHKLPPAEIHAPGAGF